MYELIFSIIGAIATFAAMINIFIWLWFSYRNKKAWNLVYELEQKNKEFNHFVEQMLSVSELQLDENWSNEIWIHSDFIRFYKEFMELVKFKEEHENDDLS